MIGWIIFYYVVEFAVKNGIKEARQNKTFLFGNANADSLLTPAQIKLQNRYDIGEVTFDGYQFEWNGQSKRQV